MNISYYDNCDTDYVKAVRNCKTLDELKLVVTTYRELAEDAYQTVEKMDDTLFEQFCKGRKKTRPSMKWMEMYGAVLLPRKILEIGLIACQFGVPFGCAYHRVKDVEAKL
jgi:hypothetical protein